MPVDEQQVVNGWAFPADIDVPSGQDRGWTRTKMGGDEIWIAGREILVHVAHQAGLNSLDVEYIDSGHGNGEIAYAAVKATVDIEGYPTASAIGSIDEPANSLEDMFSTASTRAVKRAIKAAMDIRSISGKLDDADVAGETTKTGGNISHGDGLADVEIDPPDEYTDDDESDGGEEAVGEDLAF